MSVQVKICGLTNVDDARVAVEAGADYLGFVLYPRSPRGISALQLAQLLDRLIEPARVVGVFVNHSRAEVEAVVRDCRLHAAQIHGDETASEFAGFPVSIWRAVRFVSGVWRPAVDEWAADCYVVDSAGTGSYGGSGVSADWAAAAAFARRQPTFLAGGLNPENVAAAVRAVCPMGVDVASGVEQKPGRKDPARVRAFVRAVRESVAGASEEKG